MNILYEVLLSAGVAIAAYAVGRVIERKNSAIEKWKQQTEESKRAKETIENATTKLLHDDIDELSKRFRH